MRQIVLIDLRASELKLSTRDIYHSSFFIFYHICSSYHDIGVPRAAHGRLRTCETPIRARQLKAKFFAAHYVCECGAVL